MTASDDAGPEGRVGLTPYDLMALSVLREGSGFATGRIVELATGRPTTQSMSAMMKATMIRMEKRGFVSRIDADRPIVWTRTPAGTAALAAQEPPHA